VGGAKNENDVADAAGIVGTALAPPAAPKEKRSIS
jgi:hypothetical protein